MTEVSSKILIFLFLIFLFVTSDIFTYNVISKFDGACVGRTVTTFGTILQGISLVIFYMVLIYVNEHDYI
jgi:hypothetical protein